MNNDNILKTGVELIQEERDRQIQKLGYTPELDDSYILGQLAHAAAIYAKYATSAEGRWWISNMDTAPDGWPLPAGLWKPSTSVRMLTKAGALIAAELDRIQRLELRDLLRGDTPKYNADSMSAATEEQQRSGKPYVVTIVINGKSATIRLGPTAPQEEADDGHRLRQYLNELTAQKEEPAPTEATIHARATLSALINDPELRAAWAELERIHAARESRKPKV